MVRSWNPPIESIYKDIYKLNFAKKKIPYI